MIRLMISVALAFVGRGHVARAASCAVEVS